MPGNYTFSLNPDPMAALNNVGGAFDTGNSNLPGNPYYDENFLKSLQGFGGGSNQNNSFMTDWFGKNGKGGYANTALDVGKGLFGMWAGIKGMNMAKDQFNQQKMISNANLDMTRKNYNMRLEDRYKAQRDGMGQAAVIAQNMPSIAEQMKKYGA